MQSQKTPQRLRKKALLVFVPLLLVAACNSSGSHSVPPPPPPPPPTLELGKFCSPYNDGGVRQDSTLLVTLPGNRLSGERLVITSAPRGEISGFNDKTGTLSYTPPMSRLPDRITYERRDGNDNTVGYYEHYWVPQPLRIMPLGDSITAGVEFSDGSDFPPQDTRVGYRKALYDRLIAKQQQIDFIGQAGQSAGGSAGLADPDHNGFSGADIADLTGKVQPVFDEASADIVLLHIGTNNTPEDASSLLGVLDEIESWARSNHPVKVFVATLVPKRDAQRQALVDNFNTDLRKRITARTASRVVLVEQALALTVDDISTEPVGLHPNPGGYLKMADTWYTALVSAGVFQVCRLGI